MASFVTSYGGDSVVPEIPVIDNVFGFIANIISKIIEGIISIVFLNNYVAFFVYFLLINFIAIILMKRDKEYSKIEGAKRIRESTLLMTALMGGALGEYYAMYKYKHKTLHRNFLIGVPVSILIHFLILSYSLFVGIVA